MMVVRLWLVSGEISCCMNLKTIVDCVEMMLLRLTCLVGGGRGMYSYYMAA
jgi:hypothetical protein